MANATVRRKANSTGYASVICVLAVRLADDGHDAMRREEKRSGSGIGCRRYSPDAALRRTAYKCNKEAFVRLMRGGTVEASKSGQRCDIGAQTKAIVVVV